MADIDCAAERFGFLPNFSATQVRTEPRASASGRMLYVNFHNLSLTLISKPLHQLDSRLGLLGVLDALWRAAVNHTQHAPPPVSLGNNHFHRISGCSEDIHHLGYLAHARQHVDGKAIAKRDHKYVASAYRRRVRNRVLSQFLVVAIRSGQAIARSLIERDTKPQLGRRIHHRFIQIFHRFDEMTLAEDQVPILGDREAYGFNLHHLPAYGTTRLARRVSR